MPSAIETYISDVKRIFKTGEATEHSYRAPISALISSFASDISALNEPKRVKCGAPDFLVSNKTIAIGHIEAKDVNKSLKNMKGHDLDQQKRFLEALPNLIYTNCLDFDFYKNGELINSITIATGGKDIIACPDNYSLFEVQIRDFLSERPQTITSSVKLAEIMAGKAALVKDILYNALRDDTDISSELYSQYIAFKEHLIHDIDRPDFADIYAETIAYGMFAARLHDTTLDTFSRQEALELLPKSNPFLKSLFSYIAGPNLDDRIKWVIDDLSDVFLACDVKKLLSNFGSLTGRDDPFLHFYEIFLAKYNPKKRKARGVWYTPEAAVNFIVRAIDDTLKAEFRLPLGIADTSKVTIDLNTGQRGLTKKGTLAKSAKNVTIKKSVHRVQILDPATGTGTFLAEVIKQISPAVKTAAKGLWSKYIEQDLVPRLHGFELLMASYAMCHMKLDMVLTELGYKPSSLPPRLSVYLTNSLEEGEPVNQILPFAQWLSNEVREANLIKSEMPIMCIIGNPPYSIQSGNLTAEQIALINPYRYVDGVKIKEKGMLQFEKNINNDYIKFIALSEKLIRKNGYGILGFITSHGYLKSESFRGMRQHLMETFDSIKILDLHGNTEIREVAPDGVVDKNVFDIKQGVCIIIAFRREEKIKKPVATVEYAELWGSRQSKYDYLGANSIDDIEWLDCCPKSPNYTFFKADYKDSPYDTWVSIAELFPVYSSGVITARDNFSISESVPKLVSNATVFANSPTLDNKSLCEKLSISEKKGWDVTKARKRLAAIKDFTTVIHPISYRPFDDRNIIFDESVVWTTARSTMDHMLRGDNIAFISARSEKSGTCSHFFVSKLLVETKCGERTTQSSVFPLYLYPADDELDKTRRVNLDPVIYKKIVSISKNKHSGTASELDVLHYVYGVVHCSSYREKYSERLKIGFPKVPLPHSSDEFWRIAGQGNKLRLLHLLDPKTIGKTDYPFEGEGDGVIRSPSFDGKAIWINDDQYFSKVSVASWNTFIGGYLPAQQWLKQRKGSELTFEGILHFQKILKALHETNRLMHEITVSNL